MFHICLDFSLFLMPMLLTRSPYIKEDFLLDMVAYYAWVRKDGFNPATADAFTVS